MSDGTPSSDSRFFEYLIDRLERLDDRLRALENARASDRGRDRVVAAVVGFVSAAALAIAEYTLDLF